MKIFLSMLTILFSITDFASTVKGAVGIVNYPNLMEFAEAYDKARETDARIVSARLIESFYEVKKPGAAVEGAVIEMQRLPDFKVLDKTITDGEGHYELSYDGQVPYRLFSYCTLAGKRREGYSYVEGNRWNDMYEPNVVMKPSVSLVGRCVGTNGQPYVDAVIDVEYVTSPLETEERNYFQKREALVNSNGSWRIDGVERPSHLNLLSVLINTNYVKRTLSTRQPYGIVLHAYSTRSHTYYNSLPIANVTADDRVALERIIAAYKRKTGRACLWPEAMTDFPASTNNVIYVPDIVLK